MSPRRCSPVTNMVATTSTAMRPVNPQTRVFSTVLPRLPGSDTIGVMSPWPVMLNSPAFSVYPVWTSGVPPMSVCRQPDDQSPSVVTSSKVVVVVVGPPFWSMLPNERLVSTCSGDDTNMPATTSVPRSTETVLIVVQCSPSGEVAPVSVFPLRVNRSQV